MGTQHLEFRRDKKGLAERCPRRSSQQGGRKVRRLSEEDDIHLPDATDEARVRCSLGLGYWIQEHRAHR